MSFKASRAMAEQLGLTPPKRAGGRTRESRPRKRRAKPAAPRVSEASVQRACLDYLRYRSDVVALSWRNNTGMLRDKTDRPVRFGKVGSSDILGCVRGSGRLFACEVKAPGGKPTDAQRLFLHAVSEAGGVALLADDLAVVERAVRALEADPQAVLDLDGTRLA